jgi:hypothetical protein
MSSISVIIAFSHYHYFQGNILIDDQWHACLADFGLTVFANATLATQTSHGCGSTRWMSPQLLEPEGFGLDMVQQTCASDVYAFACVCLEVSFGIIFSTRPTLIYILLDIHWEPSILWCQ